MCSAYEWATFRQRQGFGLGCDPASSRADLLPEQQGGLAAMNGYLEVRRAGVSACVQLWRSRPDWSAASSYSAPIRPTRDRSGRCMAAQRDASMCIAAVSSTVHRRSPRALSAPGDTAGATVEAYTTPGQVAILAAAAATNMAAGAALTAVAMIKTDMITTPAKITTAMAAPGTAAGAALTTAAVTTGMAVGAALTTAAMTTTATVAATAGRRRPRSRRLWRPWERRLERLSPRRP